MTTLLRYWIPVCFLLLALLTDVVQGLQCWHCIADNCHMNPSDNYKASKKECQPNQCCQKVIFTMFSPTDKVRYTSTIRSCAGECDSHDDRGNCTDELYTTRGCVTKTCCTDKDLCNTAPISCSNVTLMTLLILSSVIFAVNLSLTSR